MSVRRAAPVGCGHYLPERVVENAEFAATLDTSDEWIRSRSGIERRRFAAPDEKTSDLATHAARAALANAGMEANELDAIILATATPDQTFPSTATRVQHALGMTRGFAFDVQAVCAGFIFALSTANSMIVSGQARNVMVIGAETFTRIMDWTDRSTCVLFGDGAGALILSADEGEGTLADRGVLATRLHSDGAHNQLLYVDGGPSATQTVGVLRMEGRKVFQHAVQKLAEVAHEAMEAVGARPEDIDWMVPHQANIRIIEATARKTGLPMEKVVVTVQNHGNTSAASIPLALSEAAAEGRIRRGDLLLMEAIGGGLAWGAALVRW
ncbi:beta-ketoacyl-ACP synthase III [Oceanicella actignis]|uniref:Beta-ketoacyl-[acyl-carrier-protein] synthase III n=1 Tax=Oceanicella actignis TaxID=1189325 RepID=A0A1M7SA33_9RHOB|nr:beta-ketoacyl-ACP synthase III [Oceanicella actignis]TYO91576.1 3-oxoacyl-[acyl-carrier-protein] synthase-3 [Oceanicella actignis]SET30062.1 3-oxoacyl-[acyl-carrier-protein] synthase III [Oceanicella actignis]SHN55323.1 3-oxoacyl-[acyl-carrier-protein] synthase-3 [Oceanicella actignis]